MRLSRLLSINLAKRATSLTDSPAQIANVGKSFDDVRPQSRSDDRRQPGHHGAGTQSLTAVQDAAVRRGLYFVAQVSPNHLVPKSMPSRVGGSSSEDLSRQTANRTAVTRRALRGPRVDDGASRCREVRPDGGFESAQAEAQIPSKLVMRVRFSSPAPQRKP
jgi:hypothetical protein